MLAQGVLKDNHVARCMLSHFSSMSDSVTLWTILCGAHQAPLSMELSRQEHWSGLPFPPAGDLHDPGVEPTYLTSLALVGKLFTS